MREHLTCSNLPSCQCAICLYGFRNEDEFTKTPCFHHFHAHCLASYVRSCQETHRQERETVPLWQKMQQKDSEDCVVGFALTPMRALSLNRCISVPRCHVRCVESRSAVNWKDCLWRTLLEMCKRRSALKSRRS